MNNENKKKSILFLGILVAVLTCLTVGFAYAYYRAVLKGEKENKVVVSGATVVFTEPEEALESTTLIKKGETFDYTTLKSYDFSVDIQSKGDTKLNYQVEIEPLSSGSNEITDGYYLLGDANRDAEINIVDLVRCKRYIDGYSYSGQENYLNKACDANKDGVLNTTDTDTISNYLAGYSSDYLGKETFLYGTETTDNNKYLNGSFYIGDSNADGVIDTKDKIRCSKALANITVQNEYIKQACDINKDGSITQDDMDILGKYLSHATVEQPLGTDTYKFDYKGYTMVSNYVNSVAFYLTDENNNPVGYTGTTGKTASELRSVTSTDEIIVYKSKVEFTNGKLTSIDDVAQSAGLASYTKNFKLRAFALTENDGTVTTTTDGNRHEATSYVVNYKFKVNVVAEEAS